MKTIKDIIAGLKGNKPGTVLDIAGYVNSEGQRRDIRVELLDTSAYKKMLKEDLDILRAADTDKLARALQGEDLSLADVELARQQLISAKESSLDRYEEEGGSAGRGGPEYKPLDGNLATTDGNPSDVYLLRLRSVSEPVEAKAPKGAVPRAKQFIGKILQLPTRRYIHVLRFAEGKFEEVTKVG
jgi:hypothetical protein